MSKKQEDIKIDKQKEGTKEPEKNSVVKKQTSDIPKDKTKPSDDENSKADSKEKKAPENKKNSSGLSKFYKRLKTNFYKLAARIKLFLVKEKIKIIIVLVLFLLLVGLLAIVLLFKLDSFIFPSKLEGSVYNILKEHIYEAEVCIKEQNKCTKINEEGNFIFTDLKYGFYSTIVKSANFEERIFEIYLHRGDNHLDFNILPEENSNLRFQLILPEANVFNEENFKILLSNVDEPQLETNNKGVHAITSLKHNDYTLNINSPKYKNIEREVTIDSELTDLGLIQLEPAATFKMQIVDWLSEKTLGETIVTMDDSEIKANKNGVFLLIDQDLGIDLDLLVSCKGYLPKELSIEDLKQGMYDYGKLGLVREGSIFYTSNRDGDNRIYVSNLDGSEEMKIDSKKISPNHEIEKIGDDVYFIVEEKIKDKETEQVYKANLNNGNVEKISKKNYDDNNNNIGTFTFAGNKRLFRKYSQIGGNIYVGDLAGLSSKLVFSGFGNGYISNQLLAPNGKFFIFNWDDYATNKDGLHIFYLDNSQRIALYNEKIDFTIYNISHNNNVLVFRKYDYTSTDDLWTINLPSGKPKQITQSESRESKIKFSPDDKYVSFTSHRDNKNDIYLIDLSNNEEIRMTDTGKVTYYYWGEDGLLFFYTENGLYVVSIENPLNEKLVTEDAQNIYSYCGDWYYY